MRRFALLAAAAALLAGCTTTTATLLPDSGGGHGALAVLDAKTGAERGSLTDADTQARLGARNPVKARKSPARRFAELFGWAPPPPRVYVMYFIEGGTDLTEESKPILEALRAAVTDKSEVQITGHTDTVGSAESNDALSRDRAVEIRAALVKQGLPLENAKVTGRGERELRIPTADEVAEPGNRRVEVILR